MQPIDVKDSRQLLFDNRFLDRGEGVSHQVNVPHKTNEKLLVADRPWEEAFVGPYCTVMEDDGIYRMWYESYYRNPAGKLVGVLCYAESDNAAEWRKPILKLHEVKGTMDNNVVFPLPGRVYHGGTVFKDPTAVPAERYKLFYYEVPAGIRAAHSPDGLHWTIYEGPPLFGYQCDTQNVCFWDIQRQKYVAYMRFNRPLRDPNRIRTIGRSETTDFLHWPPATMVMTYDNDDPEDADLYNSAAIQYPDAADSYFIIASLFHQKMDCLQPQLAVSRDGIKWQRPSRQPFIALGSEGSFDSKMIHTCVGQFRRGEQWLTFYRGTSSVHTSHGNQSRETFNGVISKVVSRPDGFVSVDAKGRGWFTTPILSASSSELAFNFQTEVDGQIAVELCDVNGETISGFAREDCIPVSGDQLNGRLRWRTDKRLETAILQPFRLRVHLERAKLYAFQFLSNGETHG